MEDITDKYEDPHSSPSAFHKMDQEYIRKNLKAITGFEIMVSDISHVFKMSQDHSRQDRERLVEDLLRKEDALSVQMAEEMKRNVKTKQNNQEQLINGVLWIVHGEFTFPIV